MKCDGRRSFACEKVGNVLDDAFVAYVGTNEAVIQWNSKEAIISVACEPRSSIRAEQIAKPVVSSINYFTGLIRINGLVEGEKYVVTIKRYGATEEIQLNLNTLLQAKVSLKSVISNTKDSTRTGSRMDYWTRDSVRSELGPDVQLVV